MYKSLRNKIIFVFMIFASIVMALGLCLFGMQGQKVSAATYTTPKYLTNGRTTNGTSVTTGCPSNFKIYMYGSSRSGTGTLSQGSVIDWSYVYITVETSSVSDHLTFQLLKNGSVYTSKSLSGNASQTLYSGSLSDGNYELQYSCRYAPNIFVDFTYYFYTFQFEVDKTAPSYSLKAGSSTISSGSYTNQQIVYSATDENFNYIKYKRPSSSSYSTSYSNVYTVAATSSNNGWWYFYATDDKINTTTTVSAYLDTVAPVGKVTNSSGVTIANGGYTNSAFKYTATDTGGVSKYEVKKAGTSTWTTYTSGTSLTGTYGWYYFRATDKAGNVSDEYKVYYDAASPSGTLYGGTAVKSSGTYTNADYIKYTASDSNSGLEECYVKMPGSSSYSAYASGTQLATEGTYSFYSKDKSGNQSITVTITLDKTKPTGTLYGGANVVQSGNSTNAAYIKFVPYDAIGLSSTYVKKPGASTFVSYTSGTQLTDEGTYSFYATDKAGNTSETYTITLNRQIPEAQLYADNEAIPSGAYTNAEHIRFESAGECFVKLPDGEDFIEYVSGVEYYKPGKYTFYAQTESGTLTEHYTVVIDRTQKQLTIENVSDGMTDGDVTIMWTDGDVEQFAPVVSVTVNGKTYNKGTVIYTIDTGVYEIICTDAAGNVWSMEFTSSKQNVLTETLQKEYWEAADADGNLYAFATYDAAFAFAAERENSFVRTGEWNSESWDTGIAMDAKDSVNAANGTYFIYKKSGNPEEEVAYFTQERLNEVIAEYAKVGIESYYYWEKTPAAISDGENLYSYSDGKKVLANSVALGENISCVLDGEQFIGAVIETEGNHTLTVSDEWGNVCDYELIVIRTAPSILYATGTGSANLVTFDRTYYFKDEVTLSISDGFDEMAMFNVYDEEGTLLGSFSLGETYKLTKSGSYTVEAINHFGKSETFSLIISRNTPVIEIVKDESGKTLDIVIKASLDDESHIQTLEIYKSVNGETWELLKQDDYGTEISIKTLSYSFRTSGQYRVVVTDEFRTGIDSVTEQIEYSQPVPEGVLSGVENNGYTNGEVSFVWTDEATVSLTKDGEGISYTSGQKLTEDGEYVLTFRNYDGYETTYHFVIDTIAPEVKSEGLENGNTVNQDAKVLYEEQGVTAEIFKDGKLLGEYISGTTVGESGEYTIVVTDRAGNKTEVKFTIDKEVGFVINVNDKGLSNSVTVTADEEVTLVITKDEEVVEYKLGDAITEAGDYTLMITDALGNKAEMSFTIVQSLVQKFEHNFDEMPGFEKVFVNGEEKRLNYGTLELNEDGIYEVGVVVGGKTYCFSIMVDATAPEVVLNGAENGGTTNRDVSAEWTETDVSATLMFGGETKPYQSGDILTAEGTYELVLIDDVGNKTVLTFVIDKTVEYTVNTVDGFISNEDVVFNADEELTIRLTKDGNEMLYAFGYPISEEGDYVAVLTDQYGNIEEVAFRILKKTLQSSFNYDFGDTEITSVTLNGESCELDFEADGTYVVTSGKYSFTITLDRIAPTLELNGVGNEGSTKKSVTLENLSEQATVQVYLNDELIEYEIGSKLSETGKYRVVVTDEVGNVSEYSFEILSRVNGVLIAVLVIGVLAVIGVGVFLFLKKKKRD